MSGSAGCQKAIHIPYAQYFRLSARYAADWYDKSACEERLGSSTYDDRIATLDVYTLWIIDPSVEIYDAIRWNGQ